MSLSTAAPKLCSNLRQYGHSASSYSDSTTFGWPVAASVITLPDATRIAFVSTAYAGGSVTSVAAIAVNASMISPARICRHRRPAPVAMNRSLLPCASVDSGAPAKTDLQHAAGDHARIGDQINDPAADVLGLD